MMSAHASLAQCLLTCPHSCTTSYWMGLTLILTGPLLVAEVRHGFRGMGWLNGRFRGRRSRGASGWPFFATVPL